MRFIKFRGWNKFEITFALDIVATIQPHKENKEHTTLRFTNGETMKMEIEYEDFISQAFKDIENEKEYQIIEIIYTDPELVA